MKCSALLSVGRLPANNSNNNNNNNTQRQYALVLLECSMPDSGRAAYTKAHNEKPWQIYSVVTQSFMAEPIIRQR